MRGSVASQIKHGKSLKLASTQNISSFKNNFVDNYDEKLNGHILRFHNVSFFFEQDLADSVT